MGPVSYTHLDVYKRQVYRSAGLSLLTSKYEGFGLVLVESLQYGCPVVSYDLSYGPADIVTEGVNGYLVPPGNKRELARVIIRALSDPARLETLSRAAEQSAARFSEAAFVARWAELFTSLARTFPEPAAGPDPTRGEHE